MMYIYTSVKRLFFFLTMGGFVECLCEKICFGAVFRVSTLLMLECVLLF